MLGIDLGTTFCCLSYWNQQKGSLEVIPSISGSNTFPSVIAFIDGKLIVGEEAASWATLAPQSILWEVKRFIGRTFHDPLVQEDIQYVTYEIRENPNEPDGIQLGIYNYLSETGELEQDNIKWFTPLEASSLILAYLQTEASNYLETDVTEAVITVPAYFGDLQREATKLAAELTNLKVLRIIPEPTAAALAYHYEDLSNELRTIMVFDWGGGTLDVSLLTMEESVVEVIAIDGDHHLGGEDFDHILLERIWNKFAAQLGLSLDDNNEYPELPKMYYNQLRSVVEKAKRILSKQQKTRIDWIPTPVLIDLEIEITPEIRTAAHKPVWITRDELEEWCEGLFLRALAPVDRVIREVAGRISETEIQEVLFVGGSTRIPAIQEFLTRRFPNAKVHQRVHPDECVGRGAGIQAALLKGIRHEKLHDVLLLDVLPFSLGVETVGGVMTKLLERNTTLPAFAQQTFTTEHDHQDSVDISVYQGERAFAADNQLLGKFELTDIPDALRGTPRIEVSFDVDVNGILQVSALERISQKKCTIRIQSNPGGISEEERKRLVADAEKYREQDKLREEQMNARIHLTDFYHQLYHSLQNSKWNHIIQNPESEPNAILHNWYHYLQTDAEYASTAELIDKHNQWRSIAQNWINQFLHT